MTYQPAERTAGLVDFFNQLAETVAAALQPLTNAIFGAPIVVNENVAPDQVIHADGRIIMHPIAALLATGNYRPGPHGQLDASLDWQLEKIDRAAAAAIARLDRTPFDDRANR